MGTVSETTLTLATMGIVAVTFLVLHFALRRIPYDETAPRERWPWPVWSWYQLVIGFGLIAGLAANLYWNSTTPSGVLDIANEAHREKTDIQPVKGED